MLGILAAVVDADGADRFMRLAGVLERRVVPDSRTDRRDLREAVLLRGALAETLRREERVVDVSLG